VAHQATGLCLIANASTGSLDCSNAPSRGRLLLPSGPVSQECYRSRDEKRTNRGSLSVASWLRRLRSRPEPPAPSRLPRAPHPPAFSDAELLARTEEFNRAAEAYWHELKDEPSGRMHALNKPFGSVADSPGTVYRLGLVLAELRAGVGHSVLDFGAGSCWLASCLNRLGCRTIAIDVSPTALALGRELFAMDRRHRSEVEPRFLAYDGHHIPLADGSVDRVVCFDAFHHVPNLDEIFSEVFRVLRPGGRAVLAEPGEGHSHAGHSLFDAERHGVLENELEVHDLDRRARAAGFSDVRFKPYPDPALLSLGAADYVRLTQGDASVLPMPAYAASLKQFLVVTLVKGQETIDSRRPSVLRAEIRRADAGSALEGRPGAILPLPLVVRNAGDTLWRHEIDEIGGYVMLSGHLLAEDGRALAPGFFRTPLPASVPPGDEIELVADLPLPAELGRYRIRVDLVDECVTWFSQAGSPTLELPLSVLAHGDAMGPAGLRATLATTAGAPLTARPGTRVSFPVQLENAGRVSWPHAPAPRPGSVSLGGHLLDEQGRVVSRDFMHLPLPRAVAPGETIEMPCAFRAPLEPGGYRLRLDLVLELLCWFEERGTRPLELALVVTDEVPSSDEPGLLRAMLGVPDGGAPLRAAAGSSFPLRVQVRNVGNTLWLAERSHAGQVRLGAHLMDAARIMLDFDYLRVRLPRDLGPGDGVELLAAVPVPDAPGHYTLELDMVAEAISWFGPSGSPTVCVHFESLA